MIDLTVNESGVECAARRARQRRIVIPTFAQMKDPSLAPDGIKERLRRVGLWDLDPLNLFRITWKNEPVGAGGFGQVNTVEFPGSLTGVEARVIALVGKWFPTGSHKVGATFGCLVPRLVTGQFDPTRDKAVWPSTGNYCRGGAYVANLLGCDSIAILPQGMSAERFEWLSKVAGEVIATPGSESNVKEVFDATWDLKRTREDVVVFNQFDDFGNYLWHYEVTGHAMEEALERLLGPQDRYCGLVLTTGSAGTIACGDYLKQIFPTSIIAAGEALQCPTLLENGFGDHRIEGIGDKHVPWIHHVRNTDMVMSLDDAVVVKLARLFNERAGRRYLAARGVGTRKGPFRVPEDLDLLGFSGIANLSMAVKFAKYYELGEHDVILTVLSDSMALYQSRLHAMSQQYGEYTERDAAADHARYLLGLTTDHLVELRYTDRRRIHNLKYFTWVEQRGKTTEEIMAQWYAPDYWTAIQRQAAEIDALIEEFNGRVGLSREIS